MKIKEISDKNQWENFINSKKPDTFLQSWNWGEFNKKTGEKIWRLGIYNGEELIDVTLAVRVNARRGRFIFCPHLCFATIADEAANIKKWNLLFDYLKKIAIEEKVDFIRISPLVENTQVNLQIFKKYGFRDAAIHMMHPELSWILDISQTEEGLLKGMRKTTRNLVRRAEKENVEILEIKNIDGIDEFYRLHEETVSRHGFVPFSKKYLKNEFEALAPDNQISIFFAKHDNATLSSAIIVFYGNSAFYHHGASQTSKIPASYLLMWRIIQEAKKRGCQKINFWGIAPEGKPRHPLAGLTIFKTGFGGYKEEYLHCQDLPITFKYWFNYAVEKVRRIKRGY